MEKICAKNRPPLCVTRVNGRRKLGCKCRARLQPIFCAQFLEVALFSVPIFAIITMYYSRYTADIRTECRFCMKGGLPMRENLHDFCIREGRQELLDKWVADTNFPLTPIAISRGSKRNVWWRCKKGQNWQATVYTRTGCPV